MFGEERKLATESWADLLHEGLQKLGFYRMLFG
jgi:hypothetical protein